MNRYYVLLRHRPKWFPFNILIHEMLADDHGEGVHTHLMSLYNNNFKRRLLGNNKKVNFGDHLDILVLDQQIILHRVDLKKGTKPITIFIPGPFGLRKGPRSEYGIDFKLKK